MKVLLDECVDRRFAAQLEGVDVQTVVGMGWTGITNGKLLGLAAASFDVFVTVDRNLQHQQHLPKFEIAVVLMLVPSNRLADLSRLMPKLLEAMKIARSGTVVVVGP